LCDEFRTVKMEARVGIEPTHKGFADLSLTAWVPRHLEHCTARPDRTQSGICDFPTTPARFARKRPRFPPAACAATTFRLNPLRNPATASEKPQAARKVATWSGRRDLNPRPSPWQGDALPLSYSRIRPEAVYRAAHRPVNATAPIPCPRDRLRPPPAPGQRPTWYQPPAWAAEWAQSAA
jgi:hypothetical protein